MSLSWPETRDARGAVREFPDRRTPDTHTHTHTHTHRGPQPRCKRILNSVLMCTGYAAASAARVSAPEAPELSLLSQRSRESHQSLSSLSDNKGKGLPVELWATIGVGVGAAIPRA